ncbi:Probable protein phosphatase 2C 65 [Striga hermonthica]|uniref:Probable protein phosphatase 2C 65 n=1 Tax=Striga hermonthica TaxID=68872 RepID=A0A9N7NIJ3_STRHE|nr:Probable protein phosphatase 2C 65 [Striga hermonthica]
MEGESEGNKVLDNGKLISRGDKGALIRLQGSSKYVSMFSQQGKKGLNQDAMTVWESFLGDRETFLCGVFDGHGPSGHMVAQYIRDILPKKISSLCKRWDIEERNRETEISPEINKNQLFQSWKSRMIKCFHEMDDELEANASIESYCSGTTSVIVLKKGEHLIIANLGDSRAILCKRDENNHLVSKQLTVDLKPNLPGYEMERIKSCEGRVLAMEEEPKVYRIWMPDQDCPGLAMARAFGDFCLKDFGLISTPDVTYRKLTESDEFIVLATDGIWDVLSNDEVVKIVAAARKRSMAAKLLVDEAARAWRHRFPCAKTDDCAVICLFFKRQRPLLTKSYSEVSHLSQSELRGGGAHSHAGTDDGLDTVLNWDDGQKSSHYYSRRLKKRRLVAKLETVGE